MRALDDRFLNGMRLLCAVVMMFPVSALAGSADLARVAPENTTLYIGWSGRDHVIEAAKDTAAGKTLADPQVQQFLGSIAEAIDQALRTRAVSPDQLPIYEAAKRVLSILYRHPTALMALNMQMDPNTGPAVNAALVSHVAADGPALIKDLDGILVNIGMMAPDGMPADPTEMRPLPLPLPGGVAYGLMGEHFVLAIGPQTKSAIGGCLSGENKTLADGPLRFSREKIGGDDASRAMCGYINGANVRSLVSTLLPLFTGGNPAIAPTYRAVMKRGGYDRVKSLTWELHLKDGGCRNGIYIHTDGKPAGWLGFYNAPPITDKDLALIPRDVHWAGALRFAADNLYETILGSITTIAAAEPDIEKDLNEFLAETEAEFGLKLGDDLINLFGDTIIVYDAPEDGGILFTGVCAIFRSPDGQRLGQSLRKIVAVIGEKTKQVRLGTSQHRGHKIEFVNVFGIPIPLAPSWAMHEDWVIFGLYPQVVRNALDRILDGSPETDSILANPDFVRGRMLTGPPGAGVFYTNTKAGAEQAYSFVLPLAQVGAAMAQGEGIPLDISVFPTRRALTRHLFGDVFSTRSDDTGILFSSYGPLPVPVLAYSGLGSGVATTAMLVSILLPSLSRARELSKRLVSLSNLKSMDTCFRIYSNDHRAALPPSLQTLVDEECIPAKNLESPNHEEGLDCYVYLAGQTHSGDRRNIVVHERVGLRGDEGVNVLYLDGHAAFVRMEQFQKELAETKARLQEK